LPPVAQVNATDRILILQVDDTLGVPVYVPRYVTPAQLLEGVGFNYRGPWVAGQAYNQFDVVSYQGGTFEAPAPIASSPTFDPTKWAEWAVPGAPGAPGQQGAAGPIATAPVTAVAQAGANQALAFAAEGDCAADITLSQPLTLTIGGGTAGQYQRLTLILRQPASGGFAVTLPTNVKWASGAPPAVSSNAGDITILTFATPDGGTTIMGGI
jgi:hypothetical protein